MTTIYDEIMAVAQAADPTGHPKEGVPVHPESVFGALDGIRQRREAGLRIRTEAMADLAAWVPAARTAGLTMQEIGRLAGVTRGAIYQLAGRPHER